MSTTEYSNELAELAKALAAAQAEFTAIPKDSANPFFQSKYAGLPKVVEVASPILSKHGLSVSQFIGHDDQGDTLTTWLLHQSGQFIRDTMRLRPVKNDPQSQGSATTYGRRYCYMSVLGLVADDDDDGNRASQGSTQRSGGKSKASPSARQSRSSTPRTADPESGEIPEPPNVQAAIEKLDQEARKQLQEKMQVARFPDVSQLSGAAARQVVRWCDELLEAQKKTEPF
jgi:hypothetical protein